MRKRFFGFVLIASVGQAATAASAQTPGDWHVSVTPYLWVAGVNGDVGVREGTPPTDISVNFPDVAAKLGSAFIARADVGNGQWGVLGDVVYIKVIADKDVNVGNLPRLGAKVAVKTEAATLAGYYRVHAGPTYEVDVLAGVRYNGGAVSVDLSSAGGGLVGGDRSKSWVDPVVGVRATARYWPHGSLSAYADYGGFGVSSDAVWQVYGGYNHHFNDRFALSVGYRYYVVDFKKDNFIYDLNLKGPVIGATFNF